MMDESNYLAVDGGKKRLRATQACIICRKKKIKCDGTKPECMHCQEANISCEYTESKKRGPRKGYVQLLEERLAQLERRLTNDGQEVPPPLSVSRSPTSINTSPRIYGNNHYNSSPNGFENKGGMARLHIQTPDDFPPTEIVTHLLDLFFQHINSVFPLVHRGKLQKSFQERNVSKPLIWGVMAIAARFSNHHSIKTDPPYWAGERFALKATALVDASMLEPTISNIQFWGIMSCLEYGRASGSKAWIYGGIAARICQELGLNREEVLCTPIQSNDGSIDYVAMALRRRIFWSCLCIDKFASTSTNRPQGFERHDYDAIPPSLKESRLLRDPLQGFTLNKVAITNDPLMDIIQHYVRIVELFGEVSKCIGRARQDNSSVTWPPISDFGELDNMLKAWRSRLPDHYAFSLEKLEMYKETACQNYLNFWLCSHTMYLASLLVLHRGSLAYSELTKIELDSDLYERIQTSISICKDNIDPAILLFKVLRDVCGCNVLPYTGYCAYIFATVLMTSAFSSDPQSYRKSSEGLAVLFDTLELLRPYWPMSERLAETTRDMLAAHSRLYDVQEQQAYQEAKKTSSGSCSANNRSMSQSNLTASPQVSESVASVASVSTTDTNVPISHPYFQANIVAQSQAQHHPQSTGTVFSDPFSANAPHAGMNSDIDFNSCEFLYDSALFGQIIFDNSKSNNSVFDSLSSLPPANSTAHYSPMPNSTMPNTSSMPMVYHSSSSTHTTPVQTTFNPHPNSVKPSVW